MHAAPCVMAPKKLSNMSSFPAPLQESYGGTLGGPWTLVFLAPFQLPIGLRPSSGHTRCLPSQKKRCTWFPSHNSCCFGPNFVYPGQNHPRRYLPWCSWNHEANNHDFSGSFKSLAVFQVIPRGLVPSSSSLNQVKFLCGCEAIFLSWAAVLSNHHGFIIAAYSKLLPSEKSLLGRLKQSF